MGAMEASTDELAHPNYWNARYQASVIRRPISPASSVEGSTSTSATVESEKGKEDDGYLDIYDWFRTWENLGTWLKEALPKSITQPRILHLGCGNSTLTKHLHDLGYTQQTNIDFSEVVIRAMEARYRHLDVIWEVMDVRQMNFQNEVFDIAIDKGTMDSMFHGSMWDPPDDVRDNIKRYLDEVVRVLTLEGTFLYVTYRQPHFIRPLLVREETWHVDVQKLPDKEGGGVFEYFAYVMKKRKL